MSDAIQLLSDEEMDALIEEARRLKDLGALLERITGGMEKGSVMRLRRREDGQWRAGIEQRPDLTVTGHHASPTDALQSLVDQLDAQTETEK